MDQDCRPHRLSRFVRVFNAALCKATRNKAGVDDLPQGLSMAQRIADLGILIQALTAGAIPQQWQKRWWSRSTRVKAPFRHQQLQLDQPAKHAYKLILMHDYNFTGWPSVVPFGAGSWGCQRACCISFSQWSAGSGRASARLWRF